MKFITLQKVIYKERQSLQSWHKDDNIATSRWIIINVEEIESFLETGEHSTVTLKNGKEIYVAQPIAKIQALINSGG